MNCCYHGEPVVASLPRSGVLGAGWHVWLEGCCGLPAWICRKGELNPANAPYCSLHGCERPPWSRVAHEVDRELRDPTRRVFPLPRPPMPSPRSRPLLAGALFVYLSADDELIAWSVGADLDSAAILSTEPCGGHAWVEAVDGDVVASLEAGRALSWDEDRLWRGLRRGRPPAPGAQARSLVADPLPDGSGSVTYGAGEGSVKVSWDVFQSAAALEAYAFVRQGRAPGPHLITRRGAVPLRPLVLHQAPFPVAGGAGLIADFVHEGQAQTALFLVPDQESGC